MKHMNRHRMCSIAIRTTGPFPRYHDLAEITVISVDECLRMDQRVLPFTMYIQPTRLENIDYEELKAFKIEDNNLDYSQFRMRKDMLTTYIRKGVEESMAAELFVKWFEENLKPDFRRKIIPLVYDYSYCYPFLEDWLGRKTMDLLFDQRYRDLRACSLFMNDRAGYRCDITYPFAKNNFKYICSQLKVDLISNNTMSDAFANIQCYERMCRNSL